MEKHHDDITGNRTHKHATSNQRQTNTENRQERQSRPETKQADRANKHLTNSQKKKWASLKLEKHHNSIPNNHTHGHTEKKQGQKTRTGIDKTQRNGQA